MPVMITVPLLTTFLSTKAWSADCIQCFEMPSVSHNCWTLLINIKLIVRMGVTGNTTKSVPQTLHSRTWK